MTTDNWQSPETIAQLSRLDRAGFAFEFLRRNRCYRRDYGRMLRQIARGKADPRSAQSGFARQWGLEFRS